ncbi:MAG: DUF354 domain-containing protein [Bacteroidota bacterium]|nr:DUF354 domain-containing protein [Bacteroidota bacterium]
MKILIDIGHPAHVHYFRNFIKIMEQKGHSFLIIAKNRNITYELLRHYNIPFKKRKDYPSSLIGKLINIPLTDFMVIKNAMQYKPDIMMGFSGTHIAHAGKFLGVPSIVIDDTEHARLAHLSYKFFATHILTPECFKKNMGHKQIRFNGYMELCYLHPHYFKPDSKVMELLKIDKNEKFIILRFVSWNASHDVGHSGLSLAMKHTIVKELSKYAKVFISSEGELPKNLKPYQIKIPPQKMHDALAFATLLYGESSTMASECACLGTPAFFNDNDGRGYTNEEEEKYGLVFNYSESFQDQNRSLRKALELLKNHNIKQEFQSRCQKMLADKIDVTAFMVWFIEKYPESAKIMKENPDYQYNFK